jgi:hypothetical protein
MGDITDLDAYRSKIKEIAETSNIIESDDNLLMGCPNCNNVLTYMAFVPELTTDEEGGPYAIICQHCNEPVAAAYLFEDDGPENDGPEDESNDPDNEEK